jgi:hypothetical protein
MGKIRLTEVKENVFLYVDILDNLIRGFILNNYFVLKLAKFCSPLLKVVYQILNLIKAFPNSRSVNGWVLQSLDSWLSR